MKTNFDVITESPEKLADFLYEISDCSSCHIHCQPSSMECWDKQLEWLKSERKNDDAK